MGSAVGVLVVAGAVTAYASTRPDAPTYRTATVGTQTVQQVLQETGTIEPGSAATVSFPVSGTVSSVRVATGDRVSAGQVLATLDTTSLRSALASAQSTVADAKLTLHQAETAQASSSSASSAATASSGTSASSGSSGSGSGTSKAIAAAQQKLLASVRQTDQALAAATADLALATTLCGSAVTASTSATPTASPSASRTTGAPTTCAQAQQLVLADETGILALQQGVSAQESALDRLLAQSSAAGSGSGGTGSTSGSSATSGSSGSSGTSGTSGASGTTTVSAAQLAADQAAVDAAEAELAVARQNLAQARIVSPFAGVVSSVGLTVGSQATAGSSSSAIEVIDPNSNSVSISVDVAKIPLVKVGEKATVVPDGSTQAVPATVSYVAAAPSSSGGSSYLVRLSFRSAPAGLRDGIQAAVTVVVASAADALAVPTSAVYHLGSITYVLVLDGGVQKRQVVTVGAVGTVYTQVVKGLSAGQQVVLADVSAPIPTSTTNNRFARFAAAAGDGFVPGTGTGRG